MNKFAFALSFLLVLPVSVALADTSVRGSGDAAVSQSDSGTENVSVQAGLKAAYQEDAAETSSSTPNADDNRQVQGSEEINASSSDSVSDEHASTTEDNGNRISEEHRSVVASVVRSLLADSERDGGIGAEVRAVAESQDASASTTAAAMAKVEGRSKIWTVLFGTDWKSIGTLRSQVAQTDADTARLEAALSQTTDTTVKADLTAQLAAIKAEQARVTAFVDAQEKAFSLFGWFTKFFVSAGASTTASTTAS